MQFIDTSALIALADKRDISNHQKERNLLMFLHALRF